MKFVVGNKTFSNYEEALDFENSQNKKVADFRNFLRENLKAYTVDGITCNLGKIAVITEDRHFDYADYIAQNSYGSRLRLIEKDGVRQLVDNYVLKEITGTELEELIDVLVKKTSGDSRLIVFQNKKYTLEEEDDETQGNVTFTGTLDDFIRYILG